MGTNPGNKDFRREVFSEIATTLKQCETCEYSRKSDHIAHHCKNCPVGIKLKGLGEELNKKTIDFRNQKYKSAVVPSKVKELTHKLYLDYKMNGLLDKDIGSRYNLTGPMLRGLKRKWGILKPRKKYRR